MLCRAFAVDRRGVGSVLHTISDPIISLENVTKSFADNLVVDRFSLQIARGEIVALLGQTGAGKSTVMNLVLGQTSPTTGTVRVDGFDPYSQSKSLRGRVAVSYQTDRLLPWRTALQNVELGLELLKRPSEKWTDLATEWLRRVKLNDVHHGKFPHQLSGGMRQRVSLARALVIDPTLLLLDESFSQLDHVTSQTLRTDVHDLVKRFEKTCVFITHRIDDAVEMADRVILLSAPARIVKEVRLTAADRQDKSLLANLSREIADEMARLNANIETTNEDVSGGI